MFRQEFNSVQTKLHQGTCVQNFTKIRKNWTTFKHKKLSDEGGQWWELIELFATSGESFEP
jgi:hypothetical protein